MNTGSGAQRVTGEAGAPSAAGLAVNGLTVKRGDLTICRDVTLTVPERQITVLLGANGAGKTTLLDGITGGLPAAAGSVSLREERIDSLAMHRRVRLGLSCAEQGRKVFAGLTVSQNIAVVDYSRYARERAFELFPRLAEKRNERAELLSGGEQQMLILARALATKPKVLLVDELSLGLAPGVVRTLIEALVKLADGGMGILLVEQFVDLALEVGTTAYVMQRGQIVRSGTCESLRSDRSALVSPYILGVDQQGK